MNANSAQPDKVDQPSSYAVGQMEPANNASKLISESMLLGGSNEHIGAPDLQIDSLENTKLADPDDANGPFQNLHNHVLQGLTRASKSIDSVDYSDDDLEVDRDEEVRNEPDIAQSKPQGARPGSAVPDQMQAEDAQENLQKTQISTIPEEDADGQEDYTITEEN